MNLPTIIIIAALLLAVGLIFRKLAQDKKNGKLGCSCGCDDCASKDICHPK